MTTQNVQIIDLPILYINGMFLTWNSTSKIVLANGQCRDEGDEMDIVIPSSVTINIANNGVNGLDTGAVAASTFYYVYAIGDSRGFNPGVGLLSLSATLPTLPFGYDSFRRVGTILTDGAKNILVFWQAGIGSDRWMWYDVLISVLAGGASAVFLAQALTAAVPPTAEQAILNYSLTPTGAGDTAALRPDGSSSANGNVIISGAAAGVVQEGQCQVYCGSTQTIDYKVTGTLTLLVAAYLDQLV